MYTLAPFIDLNENERRLLVAGHTGIAHAVGSSRQSVSDYLVRVDEASSGLISAEEREMLADGKWRSVVEASSAGVAMPAAMIVAIELCTGSPVRTTADLLVDSRAQRRMDAILDYLETDFNCYDVQTSFEEVITTITPTSGTVLGSVTTSDLRQAASYLSYVHPLLAMAGGVGVKVLERNTGPETAAPITLDVYPRLLLACKTLDDEKMRQNAATSGAAALHTELIALARTLTSPPKVLENSRQGVSLMGAVFNQIGQWAEPLPDERPFPELTGATLADALLVCEATGLLSDVSDAQPSLHRTPFNRDKWLVHRQENLSNGTVHKVALFVLKSGEQEPPPAVESKTGSWEKRSTP